MRVTQQRKVILEELRKLSTHPTADELYELVRRKMPHISLATVYRNLGLMSKSGTVLKLSAGGGQARYDGDTSRHEHVRCVVCGRIADVAGPPSGGFGEIELPEPPPGYVIEDYRLEFLGRCPHCRE